MKLHSKIASGLMILALIGCSQKEEVKQQPTEVPLQSEEAKFSYAMGMDVGTNLKRMDVKLDQAALLDALKVALSDGSPRMTPEDAAKAKQVVFQKKQQEMQAKRQAEGETNKKTGEAFLAENGKKEGVKATASGLQYQVITEGKGKNPKATDTVKVHYEGKLLDGSVFDSSVARGAPATFPLNAVIPGWTEGLQLMTPGSKYKLFIPSNLAYGERGAGNKIGPNAVLTFEVELLEIVKQDAAKKK